MSTRVQVLHFHICDGGKYLGLDQNGCFYLLLELVQRARAALPRPAWEGTVFRKPALQQLSEFVIIPAIWDVNSAAAEADFHQRILLNINI